MDVSFCMLQHIVGEFSYRQNVDHVRYPVDNLFDELMQYDERVLNRFLDRFYPE